MAKLRQKSIVYEVPIYQALVLIIYYQDLRYANKKMRDNGFGEIEEGGFAGLAGYGTIKLDNGSERTRFYILINHNSNLEELRNVIAHECLHLTQDILESRGIPFKKKGANEAYTYLNSFLQGVIEKFILK